MFARICVLAVITVALFAVGSANAQLSWTVVDQSHTESTQFDLGCVQRGGGLNSAWYGWTTSTSGDQGRFRVSAFADSSAVAVVASVLCFGAEGTGSNTWTWSARLRLNGPLGATARVNGTLLSDWYRWLLVATAGDTDARVRGQVEIYFDGPGGPIPVTTVLIDRRDTRSALGFEEHEDFAEQTFSVPRMVIGDPVYGTLHVTGQFRVSAWVDLVLAGDLSANSVADFSFSGEAVQTAPPPAAAIPTFSQWALMLTMALLGMTGIFVLSRRGTR
jgi:hypothetical protein